MNDLISILSDIRSECNCFDPKEEPKYRALSAAINALSEQSKHKTGRMDDLIYRQDAIKALDCDMEITGYDNLDAVMTYIGNAVQRLKQLPSVQLKAQEILINRKLTDEELEELKNKLRDLPVTLLPSAQPKQDGFTAWEMSVADSYRKKAIIEKYRDYQIEWLTSHCDLEFCEEEENALIRLLRDTAECFLKET